jgi:hypothetical protein
MSAIQTEDYRGHKIEIIPDENAESPRECESNLGKMLCFHGRYNLGDKAEAREHKSEDFAGWADMAEHLEKEHGAVIILPLYLYDHSGLRMKVGSFHGILPQGHAEFDSGQVGFIYATREAIKKCYGVKKISKALLAKTKEGLEAEVRIYDQYLSGDVYGYLVLGPEPTACDKCGAVQDREEVESCWGYYGTEEAMAEAKRVVDAVTAKK